MRLSKIRTEALSVLCALLAVLFPAAIRAQQTFTDSGLTAVQVERMYVKGLNYLVKNQSQQGNWPDPPHGQEPAIVGLSTVAMLAHGDDPNTGPYSGAIHRGIDFILKNQNKATGYIGNSMYNHGFSTLALAEAYGAVDESRIGPALQQAVRLIVNSQEKNALHAWRYSPESSDADTTVSGAQMVALFAARNAGIPVPEKAIQDGLKFYMTVQTPDGGFGYTAPNAPNAPRTAIGCLVFALAKEKNSPSFKSSWEWLKADAQKNQPDTTYAQYFLYYGSQAYFHASPEAWQSWNRNNIKQLAASQTAEGNWDGQFGPSFATAASLLSLALNYRYLPIYER